MQRVLRWVIFGVVLDLAVAGALSFLSYREHQNRVHLQKQEKVSQCWDNLLAEATINFRPNQTDQGALVDHAKLCVKLGSP